MLRGSNVRISQKVSGTYKLIALCTGCKISATTNTEDAAVKTDANNTEVSETEWETPSISSKSWSITVEKLLSPTGAEFTADKTTFSADDDIEVKFSLGRYTFTGNAILSGDQLSGQNKQNATSSLTFTGNGALSCQVQAQVQGTVSD